MVAANAFQPDFPTKAFTFSSYQEISFNKVMSWSDAEATTGGLGNVNKQHKLHKLLNFSKLSFAKYDTFW